MNAFHSELAAKLNALMEDVPYQTANLANASALLWQELPDINWVGFYQLLGDRLVLGPFQGKPACIQIPLGKGVCGKAAAEERVLRVENVHAFPGHIACDSASNSEIVLPVYRRGKIWGVLDIDSPLFSRFTPEDEAQLGQISELLGKMLSGTE
ncbi:MAG: GAF domain-containing protein [Candidatus Faecousia sp.]|nr:GAF domain-containing protein [Candidatus Faecousia sp.]